MIDAPQTPAIPAHAEPAAGPAIPAFTPVPRQQNRRDGWSPAVQRTFIDYLADTASVREAARLVGRTASSAYRLRRHPEGAEFAAAWDAARRLAIQQIEDFALDRAANGVEVPVFAYGNQLATRTLHNESLVMFMLRNLAPDRYCSEGARGMSALDKRELARLKAQWRKEWQKEEGIRRLEEEKTTIESINKKIDEMREKSERHESPRVRAARLAYWDAMEQDREDNYDPYRDPGHELFIPSLAAAKPGGEEGGEEGGEYYNGPIDLPSPENADEEPRGPRIRTLKDDGW